MAEGNRDLLGDARLAELIERIVRRELDARIAAVVSALEGARPSSAEATLNAKQEIQLSAKEYDVDSLSAMEKALAALRYGIAQAATIEYPSSARKPRT